MSIMAGNYFAFCYTSAPLIPRREALKNHDRTLPGRGASVRDDWCAWLPDEKAQVYDSLRQHLEASYTMLSVSLNEALEYYRCGQVAKSYRAVCVTPALCRRLTDPLTALLRSLSDHAKHYGTVPNAAPLDPANFQGIRAQRAARMSTLLSRVLLSQRAQFLHKLSTLHEMVVDLDRDFSDAASELALEPVECPDDLWSVVDLSHFDLNTCLREAFVVFKSFLVALPDHQLTGFGRTHRAQLRYRPVRDDSRARFFRPRRVAQIAGE